MRRRQFARGVISRVGLAAAAVLVLATATQHAEALPLASPGAVPVTKAATEGLATEVQYRGHGRGFRGGFHGGGFRGGGFHGGGFRAGGFRGGGIGFHRGGGFRGGGVAFHHGFRAAPAFHGGYRYGGFRRFHGGGYRYAYHRPYFHRRHFHRRFYYAPSYYYPRYYYPRRCRIIWTYYGPRRICRPWWYRHHYWRPYW
ncbi:hypothetical protein [Bradyrhizobium cenepequi]